MSTSQHQINNDKQSLVLNLRSRDREEQQVVLNNRKTVIGSDSACTVVLAAQSVKPVHCMVIQGEAGTIIRNFCSDTRVNGNAIGDTWFQAEDTLSLGGVDLRFDEESKGRGVNSAEVESRSQDILDLVERLGNLESQIGDLKSSNAEMEQRACDVENQLNAKLYEVTRLEEQNNHLSLQLGSIQRELPRLDSHSEANEKAEQLESSLEQKNEIIEKFAERNCTLAQEVNELKEQINHHDSTDRIHSDDATANFTDNDEKACETPDPIASPDSNASFESIESSESFELTESSQADSIEPIYDPTLDTPEALDENPMALNPGEFANGPIDVATDVDTGDELPTFDRELDFESTECQESSVVQTAPEHENASAVQEIDSPVDSENVVQEEAINEEAINEEAINEEASSEEIIGNLLNGESVADDNEPRSANETEFDDLKSANPSEDTPSAAETSDPFKVLEMIDNARTNEIEHLNAEESKNATEETITFENAVIKDDINPSNSDDVNTSNVEPISQSDSAMDSWEANFRKEFRDELANKAASYSPKSDQEIDSDKREEIASNIAKVESDLAHLFRPKGNEDEVDQNDEVEGNTSNEPDITESTQDFSSETQSLESGKDSLNEMPEETAVEPVETEATSQLEEQASDPADLGELDFDFELAESNLAGAFSELSDEPAEPNDDGVALEYSESSEVVEDQEASEAMEDASDENATHWQIDADENHSESPELENSEMEEPASTDTASADLSSGEISQELAEDFLQAALEAENGNPYSSFLNENEETNGENKSTSLEELGFNFDMDSSETSAEDSPETDNTTDAFAGSTFSEIVSSELEKTPEFNGELGADNHDNNDEESLDSTGLSTAHLYQQSEDDEPSATQITPLSDEEPPTAESTSSRPEENESDDSYIQEYMKRLLGNNEEADSTPTETVEPKPESPSLLEKTFEREIKERQDMLKPSEFVPKTSAPENNSNLQAMRDLANESARSAIATSTRKRKFEQQSTLILILSGISFFVGASLAMLSTSALSLTGLGSVVFFAMTGFGAWHYFDLKNQKSGNLEEHPASDKPATETNEDDK